MLTGDFWWIISIGKRFGLVKTDGKVRIDSINDLSDEEKETIEYFDTREWANNARNQKIFGMI